MLGAFGQFARLGNCAAHLENFSNVQQLGNRAAHLENDLQHILCKWAAHLINHIVQMGSTFDEFSSHLYHKIKNKYFIGWFSLFILIQQ